MIETLNLQALHALQLLFGFTYYYPLFMAYLWVLGALWFYLRYEFRQPDFPLLSDCPKVSIVVPCFNEEVNVREVIAHLQKMNYPHFEIIAVNDGSTDRTGRILDELAWGYPRLRVLHLAKNQGKAIGLSTAAYLADSDYIIGIDGDALLDHNAIPWFLWHFQTNSQVGAVTGNPRIRTRSTLLGRLQVGEFSSLVGLIKRAQRVFYHQIFTASGVITAFRRSALQDVDYWSQDMLTEDMDITWKLQLRGWDVRFEPRALAWILMPETLKGLWMQRLRWAMGGLQIIGKYKGIFLDWRTYPVWPLFFEHILSIIWACSVTAVLAAYCVDLLNFGYHALLAPSTIVTTTITTTNTNTVQSMTSLLPEYSGVIIGTTCLLQMLLSMLLDYRYDQQLLRYYVWTIWYPFGFWLVNMFTIIVAIPKVLLRKTGLRARWVSPDRGITKTTS
jgi:biofilm PGA synthesis N-glycosyltransferase PgaC